MKHLSINLVGTLNSLAQSKNTNWYVRQQAILTLGWFSLSREIRQLSAILFTEWDEEVRRAILPVLCLLPPSEENLLVSRASRDESPKVSRMANFLLTLRDDATLAQASLKQFIKPNEIFFCDNFWKLYQIKRNPERNTRDMLERIRNKSSVELPGRFARGHLRNCLIQSRRPYNRHNSRHTYVPPPRDQPPMSNDLRSVRTVSHIISFNLSKLSQRSRLPFAFQLILMPIN
jgi:hypothetical protein